MKTAIDCYARGKQKEANADDYSRQCTYFTGRFVCPECGELVHLTGSKYSNHFAHYKKTDSSADCDRRIDGVPTQSVYERIGLPIYLRKTENNKFKLYIGFRHLPTAILEQAEQNRMSVKIVGTNHSYLINRERFASEGSTLLPLSFVPSNQSNYYIKYEPMNCAAKILDYWSTEADGFSFDGALFSVSGLGGKKIRHGDNISTETEYYWLRRQPNLPSFISGINMKKVGQLRLSDTMYNVFLGTFTSTLDDTAFLRLTNFMRQSLKVHLLEKQPTFVPVWPPCIKTEDGYKVNSSINSLYGRVESGNEDPKMFTYRGTRAIPEERIVGDEITKIAITTNETYINVDRKYVTGGIGIRKQNYELNGEDLFLNYMGERIERGTTKVSISENDKIISINLPYAFDYIIVNRKEELMYRKMTSKIVIDNIKDVQHLLITSNRVLYFALTFELEVSENEADLFSIDRLLEFIQRNQCKKVLIPYKYEIFLKQKYQNSAKVNLILNQREIPITALRYLEEYCNGRL